MSSLKIGKSAVCWVKGNKIVDQSIGEKIQGFEILGFSRMGDDRTYLLEVPNDWRGWTISKFHIQHNGVLPRKLSSRFYEVSVNMIVEIK
jgi:hypothetical protein